MLSHINQMTHGWLNRILSLKSLYQTCLAVSRTVLTCGDTNCTRHLMHTNNLLLLFLPQTGLFSIFLPLLFSLSFNCKLLTDTC